MKVTSKGQVTIPQEVRERLGIHPGSEVEFVIEGDEARIVLVDTRRARMEKAIERMRGSATLGMTTDEIMALTRGEE